MDLVFLTGGSQYYLPLGRGMMRWLLVLVWGLVWGGCSCQGVGLQIPSSTTPSQQGQGKQSQPSTPSTSNTPDILDITDDKQTYAVSGVSALTFYPKEASGLTGSFGGYGLFYSQPQDTNVEFASLKNGECREVTQDSSALSPIQYTGVDVGPTLVVMFPGLQWDWFRQDFLWNQQKAGVFYPGSSVERMSFPYEQTISMAAKGHANVPMFLISWKAPARLDLTAPPLDFSQPHRLSRSEDFELVWKFVGKAPYLAVRINQSETAGTRFRSVTCRFAPDGFGVIPVKHLSLFKPDPTGHHTHLFLFSGRYVLAKVTGLPKPFLVVMEAITTSSVVVE